jgi:two-component sensor histidine kinase/ABC-type amino acid transport substrate-binding protein
MLKKIIIVIILSTFCYNPVFSEHSNLRVGVYENSPLVYSDESGMFKGFTIDLLHYIAEKEDWTIEFVPGTWDECLNRLENHETDIQVVIAKTDERTQIYDFTEEVVFTVWGQLYAALDTPLHSILDADAKTVALYKGSYLSEQFKALAASFDLQVNYLELENYDDMYTALINGKADAAAFNRTFGENYVEEGSISRTPVVFSPIPIRYAFPKGLHLEEQDIINNYLKILKDDNSSVYYQYLNNMLGQESGVLVPVWVRVATISFFGLLFIALLIIMITRRQVRLATKELKQSLVEKDTLIKEVHHRVKNNLNTITSLFSLKSISVNNKALSLILDELSSRIMSIAFVHEQLYKANDFSSINMEQYVNRLLNHIMHSLNTDSKFIALEVENKDITLNVDTAIPCGLIINEIISNSLKHAFDIGQKGKISVKFFQNGNKVRLEISDNGKGLPKDFDIDQNGSMGIPLIQTLALQIEAEMSYSGTDGVSYTIEFERK